jgi:hypothetical protein
MLLTKMELQQAVVLVTITVDDLGYNLLAMNVEVQMCLSV